MSNKKATNPRIEKTILLWEKGKCLRLYQYKKMTKEKNWVKDG